VRSEFPSARPNSASDADGLIRDMHKGLRLSGWIGAHVNALKMIGGVPKAVVCDNLKAGVTAVCRYEARRPGLLRCRRLQLSHCPINAPTG
jgi:hypothetical protein